MYTEKKKILVFTDWYLPGYRAGGPIRSLANLVSTLKHDFYIVTRNTDHHSNIPYAGITPNKWIKQSENVNVIYFEEENLTASTFQRIFSEQTFDKIYFNSLFSPRFTLLPLRVAKKLGLHSSIVLAPRGMLKPGALSIKARKKKIFLLLAKFTGLFRGIRWHVTSEDEKEGVVKHFLSAHDIRIAPNLSNVPMEKPNKPNKQSGELKLICIARISAEKGILEAIQFLKQLQPGNTSCDFYGTQQNPSYLEECRKLADTINGVKIRFMGEIPPHEIPDKLKLYHFFYMATWGENFGHAISEALTNATPVIISDKTPWRGLEEKNAGWDIALDATHFGETLNRCLHMTNSEYGKLCEGAYKHGRHVALDHASIEACYQLFD
jgi:glycosyltransferase involved in cell wall biosynthesis